MPLSPAAAAKKVGVSRALVSRALKEGSLRGTLKNSGHWSISEDDLEAWASTLTLRAGDDKAQPEPPSDRVAELEEMLKQLQTDRLHDREQLGAAHATIENIKSALDDAKSDRDAWRAQAETLAKLSIEKEELSKRKRVGLFSFFFRN